jgi:hypothetical protein
MTHRARALHILVFCAAAAVATAQTCHPPVAATPASSGDPAPIGDPYHFGALQYGSPSLTSASLTASTVLKAFDGGSLVGVLTPAMLGIPASLADSAEILAVSYANNEFALWSITEPSDDGREMRITFAVKPDPTESDFEGHRQYAVMTTSTGSASCPYPSTDFESMGPFAVEGAAADVGDQLTAVAHEHNPIGPIFFTVSRETAFALRSYSSTLFGNVDSSDILISPYGSNTYLTVAAEGHVTGRNLHQDDEITALAVNAAGCALISLSHDSPSIVLPRSILSVGPPENPSATYPKPNMILGWVTTAAAYEHPCPYDSRGPNFLFPWAVSRQIGLPVKNDWPEDYDYVDILLDLDIIDPVRTHVAAHHPTLPLRSDVGNDYVSRRSFFIDKLDGGPTGRVSVLQGQTVELHVNLSSNSNYSPVCWALYVSPPSASSSSTWLEYAFESTGDAFLLPHALEPLPAYRGSVALVGNASLYPGHSGYYWGSIASNQHVWTGTMTAPYAGEFYFSLFAVVEEGTVLHVRNGMTMRMSVFGSTPTQL